MFRDSIGAGITGITLLVTLVLVLLVELCLLAKRNHGSKKSTYCFVIALVLVLLVELCWLLWCWFYW